MGVRLREYRKARCWSQNIACKHLIAVADRQGLRIHSWGTLLGLLGEWERGVRVVSSTYQQLWAEVYGTTPGMLGIAGAWSRNHPVVTRADIERGAPTPQVVSSPKDPLIGGLSGAERIELEGVAA
ncbi:XRE family transcriptional regulator [Saccharopolyspora erythraea]|uniref:XRE family transcriptional regulator n=1 Tax=Saccharopolyspora erythraea TaxID=1836 RepID=UPI00193E307F|nr:XRE family transcriptional regulator [Saccharopolyspora erythraea]QRK90273.1 XRE family transcriptional regulator [Saccharopolyspora erythraea]